MQIGKECAVHTQKSNSIVTDAYYGKSAILDLTQETL